VGHPYAIREIARQAGLSEATVDRVLNDRGGVRATTARQVRQAISDLERQETQLHLGGRAFIVDVVMQTPERFSTAVRAALESQLPALRPALMRSRFHFRESGPVEELVAVLDKVARRGSHGVILKAPDVPEVTAAVERLAQSRIPVVTLVTDLPGSPRLAYVGVDNRAAGATAAYLLGQWLGDAAGSVLISVSRTVFRGEEEREMGFRSAIRTAQPHRLLVEITDTDGLDSTIRQLVLDALDAHPDIAAVYSIGGGNVATLDAFAASGRRDPVFIAHDLDDDNTRLLRKGRISAVLHHDLNQDMMRACQIIMQAHHALPGGIHSWPSNIHVVTPYNLPVSGIGPPLPRG
jgi:LacI family transcriptional regulator